MPEDSSDRRRPYVTIYGKLSHVDLDGEGKLHLVIEKENVSVIETICRLARLYFLGKEVYLYISFLESWNPRDKSMVESGERQD